MRSGRKHIQQSFKETLSKPEREPGHVLYILMVNWDGCQMGFNWQDDQSLFTSIMPREVLWGCFLRRHQICSIALSSIKPPKLQGCVCVGVYSLIPKRIALVSNGGGKEAFKWFLKVASSPRRKSCPQDMHKVGRFLTAACRPERISWGSRSWELHTASAGVGSSFFKIKFIFII